MAAMLRHTQRICAIAILALFWNGCSAPGPSQNTPGWWFVCDGNPLVALASKGSIWAEGGYMHVRRGDGSRLYFGIERYQVCQVIHVSQMAPAIAVRLLQGAQ